MNADREGSRGGLACLAVLVAATVGFALLVAATGAAADGMVREDRLERRLLHPTG